MVLVIYFWMLIAKNVIFEADENWNIEILRERIRQLGIREEWMERKELQWEEMEAGK